MEKTERRYTMSWFFYENEKKYDIARFLEYNNWEF